MSHYIYKFIVAILLGFMFSNCSFGVKEQKELVKEYTGWWVYGEGYHIFKDEMTLKEWNLIFPHEDNEELIELYLSVCEMEYFPMECVMKGTLKHDTLEVVDFEITYIQGCGEDQQ